MTGSPPVVWDGRPQLAAVRGWARRRFSTEDLDWIGVSSSEHAEKLRYTRTVADGVLPEQFHGLLGAFATPPSMREAARRAEQVGEPTAWAGLDLLFVPMEYTIESRPAWWRLGTRPAVARLLLDAFGLGEVSIGNDPALIERLLAWLPAYIPGRGCGAYVRRLMKSVDGGSDERWPHFPGEDRGRVAPTRLEGEREVEAVEAEPALDGAEPAADADEADEQAATTAGTTLRVFADGEVQAVRRLSWYARRAAIVDVDGDPETTAPALAFEEGLLVGRGATPALAPEDGVVRLTSGGDSHLDMPPLRVVPPWTQVRFIPRATVSIEAPAPEEASEEATDEPPAAADLPEPETPA